MLVNRQALLPSCFRPVPDPLETLVSLAATIIHRASVWHSCTSILRKLVKKVHNERVWRIPRSPLCRHTASLWLVVGLDHRISSSFEIFPYSLSTTTCQLKSRVEAGLAVESEGRFEELNLGFLPALTLDLAVMVKGAVRWLRQQQYNSYSCYSYSYQNRPKQLRRCWAMNRNCEWDVITLHA